MEDAEYAVMATVERDHWWYRGMRHMARVWLQEVAQPGWRSVDIGCGTGGSLGYLLNEFSLGFGLDLAPQAVEHAWNHAPNRIVRATAMSLPYSDQAFDLVTAFEVLYHRAVPSEAAVLAEMVRVTKPSGWVLIRMPSYNWLYSAHDQAVHTRRRYVIGEVRDLLVQAGLRVARLSYVNSALLPLVIGARLVERLRPATTHDSAMALPSGLINHSFEAILNAEARWLGAGGRLPAGLSILALAQKQ